MAMYIRSLTRTLYRQKVIQQRSCSKRLAKMVVTQLLPQPYWGLDPTVDVSSIEDSDGMNLDNACRWDRLGETTEEILYPRVRAVPARAHVPSQLRVTDSKSSSE